MPHYPDEIQYSRKYTDDTYEYRHVVLTKYVSRVARKISNFERLLKEEEWRSLGVTQSRGWEHYEIHKPEEHILLFRRLLGQELDNQTIGHTPYYRPGRIAPTPRINFQSYRVRGVFLFN